MSRLCAEDATHDRVVQSLQQQIVNLQEVLFLHGIAIPHSLNSHHCAEATISVFDLEYGDGEGARQNLCTIMPSVPQHSEEATSSEPSNKITSEKQLSRKEALSVEPLGELSPPNSSTSHPHGLDTVQIAIDFVLE